MKALAAAALGLHWSGIMVMLCEVTLWVRYVEKEMATHSSGLAWRIPGMAELGGLPSMGSHRAGHD